MKKTPFPLSVLVLPALSLLLIIGLGACTDMFGGTSSSSEGGWDGIDHSSSSLLQSLPSVDIAEYDLSLQSGTVARNPGEAGARAQEPEWSVGAGFAKALRNRSIAFSRKAEYLVDLLQFLDTVFEQMDIGAGESYLSIPGLPTPFLPFVELNDSAPLTLRIVADDTGDCLAVDIAVDTITDGDKVRMQVYTDGRNDGDKETHIAEVWMNLDFNDGEEWERQWIKVDTTNPEVTLIDFEQTGVFGFLGDSGPTSVRHNYTGSLEQHSELSGEPAYNHVEGAVHEDFTGGENFAYTLRYAGRFDEDYGATVAHQTHIHPSGTDSYGPQSWNTTTNKVVDHTAPDRGRASDFYTVIDDLAIGDLPDIDPEAGLAVDKISGESWAALDPWNGSIPEGVTPVELKLDDLDLTQIPMEIAPNYERWEKYDDLTSFTDLENEDPEQIFGKLD